MAKKKRSKKPAKKAKKRGRKKGAPQEQICVRMEKELYDLIVRDAKRGARRNPAQVRMILRERYAEELPAK